MLQQSLDINVELDRLLHTLKAVNTGGNLALQRYTSLLQELHKIGSETSKWQRESELLLADYWELADVEAVKSDVELRLALRELQRAAPTNTGALFAQAITLMRLGKNKDAMQLLDRLTKHPQTHVVAKAARAELLGRLGDSRRAEKELRLTLPAGKSDGRIRMHRALAFAAIGKLEQAEKEWEAVLKLGGHNIAAYRALAMINSTFPSQSDRTRKKAMENARLATQLASEDWSCELAFALASVACGESAQGEKSAVRASDLTVGHNQVLCSELALQIHSGQPITWEF